MNRILLCTLSATFLLAGCGGGGNQTKTEHSTPTIKTTAATKKFWLAAFSRANCINNESITWDKSFSTWNMSVDSEQFNDIGDYVFISSEEGDGISSYRVAAINWGGGFSPGSWTVKGYHWIDGDGDYDKFEFLKREFCTSPHYISSGWYKTDLCKETIATGCNITEF